MAFSRTGTALLSLAARRPRAAALNWRRHAAAAARHGSSASGAAPTDPWSVLGVAPSADEDECKAAFRRLALSLHPDVSKEEGDAARFAAVVEAYEMILHGVADEAIRPRRAGPRGMRVIGGVLVVSIDALKADPAYEVHALRVKFDEAEGAAAAAAAAHPEVHSVALSTETVREVASSAFDSVADLRMLLEEQLALPERLRRGRSRRHGPQHELIYRGELLGEHLFLSDYGIQDGDILHFAVHIRP